MMMAAGFDNMKRLARRAATEGARIVMGGHSTVPFAGRGEAPWRELELLVESGFTPLEAITAATGTAAGFLYREQELGTLRPGLAADLVVLDQDPLEEHPEHPDRRTGHGVWRMGRRRALPEVLTRP